MERLMSDGYPFIFQMIALLSRLEIIGPEKARI